MFASNNFIDFYKLEQIFDGIFQSFERKIPPNSARYSFVSSLTICLVCCLFDYFQSVFNHFKTTYVSTTTFKKYEFIHKIGRRSTKNLIDWTIYLHRERPNVFYFKLSLSPNDLHPFSIGFVVLWFHWSKKSLTTDMTSSYKLFNLHPRIYNRIKRVQFTNKMIFINKWKHWSQLNCTVESNQYWSVFVVNYIKFYSNWPLQQLTKLDCFQ